MGREAAGNQELGSLSLNSRCKSSAGPPEESLLWPGERRPSPVIGGSVVRQVVFLEIRDSTLKARLLLLLLFRGGFDALAVVRSRGCASSSWASRAGEPRTGFMVTQGGDGAMQVLAAAHKNSAVRSSPVVSEAPRRVFRRVFTHETYCRIKRTVLREGEAGASFSGLVQPAPRDRPVT